MDRLMYLLKQGDMVPSKRVDALEQRIEMLENLIKVLQSEQKPKMGRPPKGTNEPRTESDN
jgi:hypothetical protein